MNCDSNSSALADGPIQEAVATSSQAVSHPPQMIGNQLQTA